MIMQPDIRERLGAYWVSRYLRRVLEALQQRWHPGYGEVSYLSAEFSIDSALVIYAPQTCVGKMEKYVLQVLVDKLEQHAFQLSRVS